MTKITWWYSIVCLLFKISPEEYSARDLGPDLQRRTELNVVTYIPNGEYIITLYTVYFLRYLSKELACASLMIETVTMGGDMWTWSLVPTSRRTVAEKRVLVFKTYVNEINLKEFVTLHEIVDFISILITLIRW